LDASLIYIHQTSLNLLETETTFSILIIHLTSSTKQLLDITNIIQRETTLLTSISFTDSGLVSLHTSYPLSRAWVIYSANMCFDFPNKSKYLIFFST